MKNNIIYTFLSDDLIMINTETGVAVNLDYSNTFQHIRTSLYYIKEDGVLSYNGSTYPVKAGEVVALIDKQVSIIRDEAFSLQFEMILKAREVRYNTADREKCLCKAGIL